MARRYGQSCRVSRWWGQWQYIFPTEFSADMLDRTKKAMGDLMPKIKDVMPPKIGSREILDGPDS